MTITDPIVIAPFVPGQEEGVIALILPIQQTEFGIPITAAEQPDLRDIPQFYQRDAGNFWVALADDQVIGTVALLDIGNGQTALRKMFVHPAYRGSRGVASQLLHTLFDWARAHGVREIYLGTTAKYLAAHRFYEKNGFSELRKDELPPAFPVMQVDTKFYRKAV